MSDAYGRHLLNNLLNAAGSRYLEIGTFGSTLVARQLSAKIKSSSGAIATRRPDRRPAQYLRDGDHEYDDQFRAFTHFDEALEDVFVALVDDWNHEPVRLGTRDAFARLGYDVVYGEVLGAGARRRIHQRAGVLKLPNGVERARRGRPEDEGAAELA
ncbi:hypothetical protein JL721_12059 [Aureococcus anophagefferens]|nr:hypothetical protein JL721_12059 [Aureococcus anophagefferens]